MKTPAEVRLRSCVTLEKGKPPAAQPYYGPDADRYLTPENLRTGGECELVKAAPRSARVEDGDTILLWDGSNAGEVLRGRAGILASTMSRASHAGRFDDAYFFYALKQWEPYLKGQTSGSGIPHIDKELLGDLAITEFELREQSKIAEVLSTVDRAIEETEALITKQQRIKTGLMQDLLTRGIDKHGNLRSEKTHKFKDSPLGRIPVEWDIKLLKAITEKIADRDHTTPHYIQDGVLMVSPMAFYDDEGIDFSKCPRISRKAHLLNSQKTDCRRDDLILHRIGAGLGRVRVVLDSHPEYSILHSLALIRPDGTNSESSYLKWAFRSFDVQNQMGLGTQSIGVPDLGLEKIGMLRFKIPTTLKEQRGISAILDSSQGQIDSSLINRKKLLKIKSALMQELLTGKMSVVPLLTEATIDA